MSEQQEHEIVLDKTYPSGAAELHCPICGRRLIVQMPPGAEGLAFQRGDKYVLAWGSAIGIMAVTKIVLDNGDERVIHTGNNIGLREHLPPMVPVDDYEATKENLSLWHHWLEDVDFGDWYDDNEGDPSQGNS